MSTRLALDELGEAPSGNDDPQTISMLQAEVSDRNIAALESGAAPASNDQLPKKRRRVATLRGDCLNGVFLFLPYEGLATALVVCKDWLAAPLSPGFRQARDAVDDEGRRCPLCLEKWDPSENCDDVCLLNCCLGRVCATCWNRMPDRCLYCREAALFGEDNWTSLRKHAETGIPKAMFALGRLYEMHLENAIENSHTIRKEHAMSETARLYQQAADLGDAGAMCAFGEACVNGSAVVRNVAMAHKYLQMAVERGVPRAYYAYGKLLMDVDVDVAHDPIEAAESETKAYRHLKMAYEQGIVVDAAFHLGLCYEYGGNGVDKDAELALHWYDIGAANDDEASRDAAIDLRAGDDSE